ncbi:MAG: flagellar biosynthesis protein FlhF [Gammaproteobacteria bacterium]
MKIRKYFAADMRQALNLARQEQGPDVVILGNRKVLGGVELIAAEDYDESLFVAGDRAKNNNNAFTAGQQPRTDQGRNRSVNDGDQPPETMAGKGMIWSREPSLDLVQQEINSLRQLLEQQMSGLAWGDVGRRHPLWAGLLRKLADLGISPSIARAIVEQVPEHYGLEQAWRTTLALLSYRIPIQTDNILTQGAVIAFAGASGTGKTTTVAKIAARYVLENSAANIILATLDSYRVGGRQQLSSYAKILGVPLRTIHNRDDLSDLLEQFHGRKLILIDTAGLSPHDRRRQGQISILEGAGIPMRMCLVLSATSQAVTLQQVIATYRSLNPELCALTKLDEASSLGGVLSVVMDEGLKIVLQSAGQRVPEDLQQAETTDLIARSISIMKRNSLEYGKEQIEQSLGRYAVYHSIGEQHGD